MKTVSKYGGPEVRVTLAVIWALVLLVRRQWRGAAEVITIVGGIGVANSAIKGVVRRDRPTLTYKVRHAFSGSSFPSGHSSGAVATFSFLTYQLWRTHRGGPLPVLAAVVGVIASGVVGRSRIVLGAHHTSDVLAGAALGLGWTGLLLWIFERCWPSPGGK